ncbi:hypothetical protein BKA70DRAFT_1239644 [Coprinopsis sp. MPI-PUGE-AT-0042]|nr:hypothetical protein BKA70DRAFT_1239644 [Coprinopsis sp. MPI-PUGE-AT-0042]
MSFYRFSVACWFIIGASVATLLSCIIVPFSEAYRNSRGSSWSGAFVLWLVLVIVMPGAFGWNMYGDRYCDDILEIGHCGLVQALPKLPIAMLLVFPPFNRVGDPLTGKERFAIVWHAFEVSFWHHSYYERPFWSRGRQRGFEAERVEPQPVWLVILYRRVRSPPAAMPEAVVERPEGVYMPKPNAKSMPGRPDPAHTRAQDSTENGERRGILPRDCYSGNIPMRMRFFLSILGNGRYEGNDTPLFNTLIAIHGQPNGEEPGCENVGGESSKVKMAK